MFGYTLVSKKRLKDLERAEFQMNTLYEVRRWMSSFTDLDILWDHILDSSKTFGTVYNVRLKYAAARGRSEYNQPAP